MTQRIFLAYATENKDQVRELYRRLTDGGFDAWFDDVDLIAGQEWKIEIPKAIASSRIFLACISKESGTKIGYVHRELRMALSNYAERPPDSIFLIPVRLDDCEIPDLRLPDLGLNLVDIHWVDLFEAGGFEKLVSAIKHALGEPIQTGRDGDLCSQLLASFGELQAAARAAAKQGNGNPDVEALADSLAFCLDDLRDRGCHLDLLLGLPQYLNDRAMDIERDGLERYFGGPAAVAPVLAKLEDLTKVTAGEGKQISTQDHRDQVRELLAEIADVLAKLKSGGVSLEAGQATIAETELRTLRREVAASTYNAETVSRCRSKLEVIKVKLIERTTLLTEALLARSVWQLPAGTVFRDVAELWCPQMVVIPKGRFLMGSPEGEEGRLTREGPQHEVVIAEAFALGRFPVTVREYREMMQQAGDDDSEKDRHPVTGVSMYFAIHFCGEIERRTGRSYCLPSEAQWEYACRAGTTTAYSYGDDADTVRMNTRESGVTA